MSGCVVMCYNDLVINQADFDGVFDEYKLLCDICFHLPIHSFCHAVLVIIIVAVVVVVMVDAVGETKYSRTELVISKLCICRYSYSSDATLSLTQRITSGSINNAPPTVKHTKPHRSLQTHIYKNSAITKHRRIHYNTQ
jgi:hypothetical protein